MVVKLLGIEPFLRNRMLVKKGGFLISLSDVTKGLQEMTRMCKVDRRYANLQPCRLRRICKPSLSFVFVKGKGEEL